MRQHEEIIQKVQEEMNLAALAYSELLFKWTFFANNPNCLCKTLLLVSDELVRMRLKGKALKNTTIYRKKKKKRQEIKK